MALLPLSFATDPRYLAMLQQMLQQLPTGPIAPQPSTPVARADMQVLDLIAWRVWRITASGYLMSASTDTIWLPGEPMIGEVGDYNGKGVHAYKTRGHAIIHGAGSQLAIGSVLLWGDVVEHERGYRAAQAKVASITDVVWGNEPPWSETAQRALAFLRERYIPENV